MKAIFPYVCLLIALLLCLSTSVVESYVITIAPRSQECFIEDLDAKERLLSTFEVVSGGMLDVNIRITGPDGKVIYEQEREKEGSIQFFAQSKGTYQICFSNSMSTMTSKMLSFNIYTGSELHRFQNAKSDNIEPLDQAVMAVTESIRKLNDNYSYVRTRIFACYWTVQSAEEAIWLWGSINIVLAIAALFLRTIFVVRPFSTQKGPLTTNMTGGGYNPSRQQQFGGL